LLQIFSHRPLVIRRNPKLPMTWHAKEQRSARCFFAVFSLFPWLIGGDKRGERQFDRPETGSARRMMKSAYCDNIITIDICQYRNQWLDRNGLGGSHPGWRSPL
jgi:hypothetical protein